MSIVIYGVMLLKTFILFYIIVFAVYARELPWEHYLYKNYCKNRYCGKNHMACNIKEDFGAKCAPTAYAIDMVRQKYLVLDLHNSLRNAIAGGTKLFKPAARMAAMSWDYELARLALIHSKSCKKVQDKCRATDIFPTPGQSSATFFFNGTTRIDEYLIRNRVERWLTIPENLSMDIIEKFPETKLDSAVTSFTLAINEASTRIGCGGVRYYKDLKQYFFFTCNYAHDNTVGEPVYSYGKEPGSMCKTAKSSKDPNLCSTNEEY